MEELKLLATELGVNMVIFDDELSPRHQSCLLYTSDAADDLLCVDLGGRRIIKKKTINSKLNSAHQKRPKHTTHYTPQHHVT